MRVEMRSEITHLHRRLGATMIYVTHDQIEAMTMSDRIVVMDKGRVQQVAPPLEVYRNPANLFVAGFIGTPPMNTLRAGDRIMGFRPETMTLCDAAAPDAVVRGTVDVVEPMGAETYVQVITADNGRVVARVAPDAAVRTGQTVAFQVQMERVCWFDAQTGENCLAHG